jgi:hypothetical protein
MGINFYMTPEIYVNSHPNEEMRKTQVHLGKSSAGWEFTFRGDKAHGIIDLHSWYARVEDLVKKGYKITNDNGSDIVIPIELLRLIKEKKGAQKSTPKRDSEWLDPSGNYFLDEEFS